VCIVLHKNPFQSYGVSPVMLPRAGLRHVRTLRPNRAANFRGPSFWGQI